MIILHILYIFHAAILAIMNGSVRDNLLHCVIHQRYRRMHHSFQTILVLLTRNTDLTVQERTNVCLEHVLDSYFTTIEDTILDTEVKTTQSYILHIISKHMRQLPLFGWYLPTMMETLLSTLIIIVVFISIVVLILINTVITTNTDDRNVEAITFAIKLHSSAQVRGKPCQIKLWKTPPRWNCNAIVPLPHKSGLQGHFNILLRPFSKKHVAKQYLERKS